MRTWTRISLVALIAVAAIAVSSAPAWAGHPGRRGHGPRHGWDVHSYGYGPSWYDSCRGWGYSAYRPIYHPPVIRPPVIHPPVIHPPVIHPPIHGHSHRQYRGLQRSGLGIHTPGFGFHLRF